MSGSPTEKELDLALAEKLENSAEFLQWFLSHTKFAQRNATFDSCRTDNPWGSHPFPSTDPITGAVLQGKRQSETDLLLILRAQDGEILGMHIENKMGSGKFTSDQPQMYWHRAHHWIGNPHYGAYTDFDTSLVAPKAFLELHEEQTAHFGCFLSHEELAFRVPAFALGHKEG
jgi:hypothetical protein